MFVYGAIVVDKNQLVLFCVGIVHKESCPMSECYGTRLVVELSRCDISMFVSGVDTTGVMK